MWTLITIITTLFVSQADVDALQRTAPSYLTEATAREQLVAARVASVVHHVDVDLLLSIAWHESRYTASARTIEPGHKTSCGVMTPVPKTVCTNPTLLDGYLEGAAHYRNWLDTMRGDERLALLGYAGGFKMIRACARGPVLETRNGRDVNLCSVAAVFQYRARMIRRARETRLSS